MTQSSFGITNTWFVAIDGEGVTRPDTFDHVYDMLSIGDHTLTSPDGGQLQWWEIFDFLWEYHTEWVPEIVSRRTKVVYVGFYLGYDFNQWCRTMPEDDAIQLWGPLARDARLVTLGNGSTIVRPHEMTAPDGTVWEVDILAKKRFQLKQARSEERAMYICDAGGYFQTSFVNVIAPKGKLDRDYCTDEEWFTIKEGKQDRDDALTLRQQMAKRKDTIRYNLAENRALSKVMGKLAEGIHHMDLSLSAQQWYGPGQAAQSWLKNIGAPYGEDVYATMPDDVYRMAVASYYGGWFEIFYHGYIPGKAYEYDINSAYPAIIANLPCLLCGHWVDGDSKSGLSLMRARVNGSNPHVGPVPFRKPTGAVLRPLTAVGTYWKHELEAADRAGLIESIEVYEQRTYIPPLYCEHGRPFHSIRELYNERLRIGKETPQGKACKLVYNSAYGKMAQSIGNPRYANAAYASLITAGTRTMILNAIATHPTGTDDLLMVATDGVYFRTPHDSLELDDEKLGAWGSKTKHNMTLLMPGVYWDESARSDPTSLNLKSRGISAARLQDSIGRIDRIYRDDSLEIMERLNQQIDIYSTFHMWSCSQALAVGDWSRAGTLATYTDALGIRRKGGRKTVSLTPTPKRDVSNIHWHNGAIRSHAYEYATHRGIELEETTGYRRSFGRERDEITDLGAVLDKDYEGTPLSFSSQYTDLS